MCDQGSKTKAEREQTGYKFMPAKLCMTLKRGRVGVTFRCSACRGQGGDIVLWQQEVIGPVCPHSPVNRKVSPKWEPHSRRTRVYKDHWGPDRDWLRQGWTLSGKAARCCHGNLDAKTAIKHQGAMPALRRLRCGVVSSRSA